MLGLVIAVLSYELDKFYDGSKGLKKIVKTKWTGDKHQEDAIKLRMTSPGTNTLRIMGLISNSIAVILLFWRHKLRIDWLNNNYRVEILIEDMKDKAIEFTMLDSDDEGDEAPCKGNGHEHGNDKVRLNHEGRSDESKYSGGSSLSRSASSASSEDAKSSKKSSKDEEKEKKDFL
jgi:hypothetical protein